MTTATVTKASYPYVSVPAWKTLRKKFQERPPTAQVNAAYLKAVLQFVTEDAGATLASSLKRIGFIDDKGILTDRAYAWRDDKQYKTVCDEILEEVYPPALRDAFHSPEAALADVARWFANDTHRGKAASEKNARFYLMLLKGDISQLEREPKPKAAPKASTAARSTRTRSVRGEDATPDAPKAATKGVEPDHDEQSHHVTSRGRVTRGLDPALHVDFHIHIAPDTPLDLVQQTFAAMRKYLWPGTGEGDE